MENNVVKKILSRLDKIESRLAKLEGSNLKSTKHKKVRGPSIPKKIRKSKTDLATPVKELVGEGFFKEWRTDNDVIKKLKQLVLNPKRASVSNVLRRLVSNLLQRDGEGTKNQPWRYKEKK